MPSTSIIMSFYKPLEIKSLQTKKTDQLDLTKALTKFITTQYGESTLREYETPISALQQRRNEMRNLQEKSEGSRDLCIRYAVDMMQVANHFPIDTGVQRIQLSFSWYDSISRARTTQGNSFFEIANVLFNSAVLSHQLGTSQNRNSEEGCLDAAKHFQFAAGMFSYVQKKICPNIVEKLNVDLTNEVLECLIQICLANAQQCICEKAHKKNMKPAILSKLYMGASASYRLAAEVIEGSNATKNLFDKTWKSYLRFCQYYFEAIASYLIAVELHEAMTIGKEITRIIHAQNCLVDCSDQRPSGMLKIAMDELSTALESMLKTAQHENSKIYHDRVPELKDLESIEAKSMAKVQEINDITELLKEKVADPFFNLFPIPVMEAKQKYDENARKRIAEVFRQAREHREFVQNELAKLGLPGSILMVEQKSGFPEEVHQKIAKINLENGVNRLYELKQTLDEMSSETKTQLETVTQKLDEEQRDDDECRLQYGANRWPRLESAKLTSNLRKQINDYLQKLKIAISSDALIEKKINENTEGFKLFGLDRKALDEKMPQSLSQLMEPSSQFGKSYSDLKLYLAQLDEILEQEIKVESVIGQSLKLQDKEIEIRLLASQSNLEATVQQLLQEQEGKFKELLVDFPQKENSYLQSIQEANRIFEQHKSQNSIQSQREQLLQFVYNAINKYHEICSNLQEGINFYTTMQDIAKKLLRRVEDFVFARKTEKQDIVMNIQQQISGVTIDPQYNYASQQQPRGTTTPVYSTQPTSSQQSSQQQQPVYQHQQQPYVQQSVYGQPQYVQQAQYSSQYGLPPLPQQQQPYYNPNTFQQQQPQYQQPYQQQPYRR